jgi:hypothetical protein
MPLSVKWAKIQVMDIQLPLAHKYPFQLHAGAKAMRRLSQIGFVGNAVMFSAITLFAVGCGDIAPTSNSPVNPVTTHEQASTTLIPDDVTYTVINEDIIPGTKRALDIRLNKKVSADVLRSIAVELKNSDSSSYERTFIGYLLPEMEVNKGYWATTHFNPSLEVKILGLTVEQEESLRQPENDPSREVIGSWLQDEEPFIGKISIFSEDDAFYMEKTYSDGNTGKDQMVEKPSNMGRKLMKGTRTGPDDDYYLIDDHGNLQIWSQDFDGTHVLVTTAKKIK